MSDEEKKVEEEEVVTPAEEIKIEEEAPTEEAPAKVEETVEKEAPAEEEKEPVEIPAQFKGLIEQIESMSVLELNELVKTIEAHFGVSAQMMAAAAPGGAPAEEKDSFDIELKSAGEKKIQVIKVVKDLFSLGLKDAKDLVDSAPVVLKEEVKKEEAEEMKKAIEEAGGQVELK